MSTAITRRQALSDLVLGTALILAGCGGTGAARQDPSGSTLHATWHDPAGTGQLVVGPAEPFVHRTELGGPARLSACWQRSLISPTPMSWTPSLPLGSPSWTGWGRRFSRRSAPRRP